MEVLIVTVGVDTAVVGFSYRKTLHVIEVSVPWYVRTGESGETSHRTMPETDRHVLLNAWFTLNS